MLGDSLQHASSQELAKRLIAFVSDAEQLLRDAERLSMSTELLESAFGLYKQLERQHSQSGFTSLLACFPALLQPAMPDLIREVFGHTSAQDESVWVQKHFGSTVTSRSQAAYAEHKAATKSATQQYAIT